MPKREYTPYQRKLIQRYYQNRGAIDQQRLQEIVTEIYLATNAKKQDRLWEKAAALLERADGLEPELVDKIVAGRDVEALAQLVGQEF